MKICLMTNRLFKELNFRQRTDLRSIKNKKNGYGFHEIASFDLFSVKSMGKNI